MLGCLLPTAYRIFTDLCNCCPNRCGNNFVTPKRSFTPLSCCLPMSSSFPRVPNPRPRQPLTSLSLDSLVWTFPLNGVTSVFFVSGFRSLSMKFSRLIYSVAGASYLSPTTYLAAAQPFPPVGHFEQWERACTMLCGHVFSSLGYTPGNTILGHGAETPSSRS